MKAAINRNLLLILAVLLSACVSQGPGEEKLQAPDWETHLEKKLSEFGHRNWVLVVDKAFPMQNAEGVITIETGEKLLDVLARTLEEIDRSTHVKAVVYHDAELKFIGTDQVSHIESYRESLDELIGKYDPQVMLHDSVFVKIDQASKLFKVLVLKTEEVIPYSSVFIELDCRFWTPEQESVLREAMSL